MNISDKCTKFEESGIPPIKKLLENIKLLKNNYALRHRQLKNNKLTFHQEITRKSFHGKLIH